MAYQQDPRQPRSALANDLLRKQRNAARLQAEDYRRRERQATNKRNTRIATISLAVIAGTLSYIAVRFIMAHV
jgi:hypothetical protein